MPAPPRPPQPPLAARELFLRSMLTMISLVIVAFLLNLTLFSHLQHIVSQHQLRQEFTEQLAAGTAPVGEGNFEDVLLSDGDPIARIEIPSLGLDEIVVEGTSSGTLMAGPGHRRDTALPGQPGVSVLMGRAAAFGGPFGRIQELAPGETISIVTGQGEHIYEVLGVRYAGDPRPPAGPTGEGRLILETARGVPYMPMGLARVDARLISDLQAPGLRDTTFRTLPPEHRELAGDLTTVWALVFCLQGLVAAEIVAVHAWRRVGPSKTWMVALPVFLVLGIWTCSEIVKLLPNLL